MARQVTQTDQAPQPVGPYSQAIRAGDVLYISMQIPVDPIAGSMVRTGVRAQTRRVMDNLKGILAANGATLSHLTKINLYLRNASDLEQVNIVMADMLQRDLPARSTVIVAGLPKDAALAMDAVAYLGS